MILVRESERASNVGVNEGCFISIIVVSLYVNPKRIDGARLYDKGLGFRA